MGYSADRFVDQNINNGLICCICQDVLQAPVMSACEHPFCRACIFQWSQTSPTCPIDRQPVDVATLQEPPRVFMNILNELRIRCRFTDDGCTVIPELGHLQDHEDKRCEFNPENESECQFGCGKIVKRKQMDLWHVQYHSRGSCVAYVKQQLKFKEEELKVAKNELVSTKQELQTAKEQLESSRRKFLQLQQENVGESSGNGGAKRAKACHDNELPAIARGWVQNPDAPITSADLHITKRRNIPNDCYDYLLRTVTEKLQTSPKSGKVRTELRVKLEEELANWSVCVAKVGLIKNCRDIRVEEEAQDAQLRLDISVRDLKIILYSNIPPESVN